ncbi:hypothetical protein FNAPI_13482 [Fusarium napiforme]|uniref:Uncharacterized protein n=1 Tax=Fusarium napiforme TaxID=42672 RepID=A0A8H5I5E3_9HYPO|nr:hypothetical protein FNAPI_13482 [Fusarium napiforme]
MCEPHTGNQWRDSPSEAPQHQHQQDINITASCPSATTIMTPGNARIVRQPLSPPNSPPASSLISSLASGCQSTRPLQSQSIDVLASQLGSSSLEHFHYDSSRSTTRLPETALSPISLPDDDYINAQSILNHQGSDPMELDPHKDMKTSKSRNCHPRNAQEDFTCAHDGPFSPFMPIIVDPTTLSEGLGDASRSSYRPNAYGGFQVDEGYCEDDDDFSWLQPLVPRRTTGTPDGIKKRYELGYRRSADAASRCRNTIHSVPRMRRRDKKRSRHSQTHSAATSVRGRSDSQASQMAISTQ